MAKADTALKRVDCSRLPTDYPLAFLFAPYGSAAARDASAIAEKYQVPMTALTAA